MARSRSVFDGRLASNRTEIRRYVSSIITFGRPSGAGRAPRAAPMPVCPAHVNHLAAGMQPGQINPFFDPEAKLDKMLLKYAHDILDKTPEEVKLRTMGPSGA